MKFALASVILLSALAPDGVHGADLAIRAERVPEMKAVYGQVEARNSVLARARIPGTLVDLTVTEGDVVSAGDVIARIEDDRNAFQIKAVDAQLMGLKASLTNARAELDRARQLLKSGNTTAQRVDQLQTQVDVTENQIRSAEAGKSVLVEQSAQGAVLAPASGRVLSVPVTRSAVVMAGETVATIGGGGYYLRLAIPERHAAALKQGAAISIDAAGKPLKGRLAKIYPEIMAGRVTADVEVLDLSSDFVGARILVELPVGERSAILVPTAAVSTRAGLDFVTVKENGKPMARTVITASARKSETGDKIEILSGLADGDTVIVP